VKTTRIFAIAAAAACAALVAGCSTPDTRIKDRPEAFAKLNPDQQAQVKAGQIALGFDKEAVRLALGEPDRVITVTDPQGRHEIWHYVTYEDYDGGVIYMGYHHRFWGWASPYRWDGPFMYGSVPYYDGFPAGIHDRIRVTFDASGRVVSIQEEKP